MDRLIYLDNSATTKPSKRAVEYINKALLDIWGNPSSLHTLGMDAENLVDKAKEVTAKFISADKGEIFFTSSGTEANNTAIMSCIKRRGFGNRVITTKIEHPSVKETVKRLSDEGFEVVLLDTDKNGIVDIKALKNALNDKTIFVSVMLVNNEIGSIQPIAEIGKLVRENAKKALFHCDAVQGFGKCEINVKKLGVDLLTASAHKIHGPKGVGFLYKKKGVTIAPFITGGGQENGLRSGTESVPLIAGFMGAIEDLGNIDKNLEKVNELNLYAREKFNSCDFIKINSQEDAFPYILNISLPYYRSETLLHFLESKNIFVSSGSACAKGEQSYVLKSIGLQKIDTDSALRISFSKDNVKEDIDCLFEALSEAVKKLRRSKI